MRIIQLYCVYAVVLGGGSLTKELEADEEGGGLTAEEMQLEQELLQVRSQQHVLCGSVTYRCNTGANSLQSHQVYIMLLFFRFVIINPDLNCVE